MHARGCLAEDPFVGSGDTAGRAAPQHTGAFSYGVDGRDDGEAVAGPFEGSAGLERSIDMRRADVGLPGRPGINIGVQLPDLSSGALMSVSWWALTGASPSTPVGMLMSPPHPRCRDQRDRTAKADDDHAVAALRSQAASSRNRCSLRGFRNRPEPRPNSLSSRQMRMVVALGYQEMLTRRARFTGLRRASTSGLNWSIRSSRRNRLNSIRAFRAPSVTGSR